MNNNSDSGNKTEDLTDLTDLTDSTNSTDYTIGIFDPEGKKLNPLNNQPYSPTYKNLAKFWSNLPSYQKAQTIISSIKANDVILIAASTGAGKSVIIPKIALASCNYVGLVVMTLPKKLITLKAAEFSAQTLDVNLGEQVGYQYRGASVSSEKTVLLYSTDGSIVSMIKSDPLLKKIDVLIIDEAHERKIQIDLLLYLVKNSIKLRKERNMNPLKLIIMSATINESLFRAYYKDFSYDYLFLAGKPNFPIESIYLENPIDIKKKEYLSVGKKTILDIISGIKTNSKKFPNGDILFFVCTVSECETLTLELSKILTDSFVMSIYSGFNQELEPYVSDMHKYKELNSKYERRIFISTNVAESSLTIDGIIYVIDSGLEMSVKYNPNKKVNVMNKNIITKAQITQRKGRAGRTRSGFCYHLYTPKQELEALDFPEPEILTEDMKNVCLSLMKLGCQMTKSDFTLEQAIKLFTEFIEPPYESYISDGFTFAIDNKLIENSTLSKTGKLIVTTRLDVCDGLALLYGWNVSEQVFDTVFTIICIQSLLKSGIEDFFYSDIGEKQKKSIIKKIAKISDNSEHIAIYNLYKKILESEDKLMYNIKLVENIKNIYLNQINKIKKSYSRYKITLESVNKANSDNLNIICSFNYGLKNFRAYKIKGDFKFNGLNCDLTKSIFTFDKYYSIVSYSNLLISGRLMLSIVSPWLLD
jgi:HrpA-like RNA helicase